jgi:superfamily II DNA or RNA helicase
MELKFRKDAHEITYLDPKPEIEQYLYQNFSWTNRSTIQSNKRSQWTGGPWIDPIERCYDLTTHSFLTGLEQRVFRFLGSQGHTCTIVNQDKIRPATHKTPVIFPERIWDHQAQMILKSLEGDRQIHRSPTGSGKGNVICWKAALYTSKVLVIVPKVHLLQDIKKRLEQELPGEKIGQVGESKRKWERVTVGVINSLAKPKPEDILQMCLVDLIVFDEVHRSAAPSCVTISSYCRNAYLRYGLSATTRREDGADLVMEGVIGPETLCIQEKSLFGICINKPTILEIDISHPRLNQRELERREKAYERCIIQNTQRNKQIIDIALAYYESKHRRGQVLILVEFVKHGVILQNMLGDRGYDIGFVFSDSTEKTETTAKERKQILKEFVELKRRFITGCKVLNEGVDIPSLELLVVAGATGNLTTTVQQDGRAARIDFSGLATETLIATFHDKEPNYFEHYTEKRRNERAQRYGDCCYPATVEQAITIARDPNWASKVVLRHPVGV